MFTTSNHFIAQLIGTLNREGWSIGSDDGVCGGTDMRHRYVRIEHNDGRHVEGLLIDLGEAGYRLYLDYDCITHAEVIGHVEYCASDHLPILQATRSGC